MRPLAILLLCLISVFSRAQNSELEARNGFKDLKLGMMVDSVKGIKLKKELKEHNEFPVKLYSVDNPAYAAIGEVNVNRLEIKTYKDQVYQIQVVTDKDTRLMKALESIYGKADYDLKRETYFWKGKTLILKFRSFSKTQLELVYTSYLIQKQMKEDKGKKVQAIADDF